MKDLFKSLFGFAALIALKKCLERYGYFNYEETLDDLFLGSYEDEDDYYPGYSDAIKAITDSTMASYHKQLAIQLVPFDETVQYYKAIANITKSNMASLHKVEAIKELNSKSKHRFA